MLCNSIKYNFIVAQTHKSALKLLYVRIYVGKRHALTNVIIQFNFSLTVDTEESGPSFSSASCIGDLLLVACDNCYRNYRDYSLFYSVNIEKLITFAQDHGIAYKGEFYRPRLCQFKI